MGTDVPSFLVNDVSIPRLSDIPKTPRNGGYGPYPTMARKTRPRDEANSSHDDSEQFFTASSPSEVGSAQKPINGPSHSESSGKRPISGRKRENSASSDHYNPLDSPTTNLNKPASSSKSATPPNAQKAATQTQSQHKSQTSPKSDGPSNHNHQHNAHSPPALPPKPVIASSKGIHTSLIGDKNSTDVTQIDENDANDSTKSVASRNIRRRQTSKTPATNDVTQSIPWNREDPKEWTNARVSWWLEINNFSSQWTEKFKELNIAHESFFVLVSYTAVKTLGILESPYRFVKLSRSVIPHAASIQPAPSPMRITPNVTSSSSSPTPANGNGNGTNGVFPQKLVTGSSGYGAKKDTTPVRMNPFLVSSRRTSFEKYLFLDNRLRPRRGKPPGPSILITLDGSDFKLVSINDVENGRDVRKVVYEASFMVPPANHSDIRSCCELQLTDYFCSPGEPLTDDQLWQILSAAAGDIVKFHVDAKPPKRVYSEPSPFSSTDTSLAVSGDAISRMSVSAGSSSSSTSNLLPKGGGDHTLAMPSRTFSEEKVTTPGWNVSSEEALSPSGGPGSQRFYPQTPSYLMGTQPDVQGNDYFNYPHGTQRTRSSSSFGSNSSTGPVGGPLFSSRSRRSSSAEQLVASRAAPKPPLARSLSSKYRPELSPVSSSPPFDKDLDKDSGVSKENKDKNTNSDDDKGNGKANNNASDDDDLWADAPQLEDSTDEQNSASDSGSKYSNVSDKSSRDTSAPTSARSADSPATYTSKTSPSSNSAGSESSSSDHISKKHSDGDDGNKNNEEERSLECKAGESTSNTRTREKYDDVDGQKTKPATNKLPQLVIPRTSSRAAHALMDHSTIEEDSEEGLSSPSTHGLKPHNNANRPNSNHKPTLSESSMDSPRSPGAAMLEQASIDWASRPPAEVLYENLERFFPNTDLDKPVVISSKNNVNNQSDGSLQTLVKSPPLPATAAPPLSQKFNESKSKFRSVVDTGVRPPRNPIGAKDPDSEQDSVTAENEDEQPAPVSISRAKSIRVVAREASRRLTQRNREPSSHLLRRKSTKMWGQRVVEMRKGTPNSVTLRDHKQYVWIKGELIGRGSFGKVYSGLNATTGDMMAVKQVKAPRMADPGTSVDESMKALYAEVENMKDLDHLNIVQYLGFQRLDRVSNLFLEYVPGGSVNSLLRNFGRFPDDTIRFLTRQVLEGLSYSHSRGILHRDSKADNLSLDIDGTIKISDFGISKRSRDIYTNNAEMSMQGTIFWMAPEVIHNVIKNQKQGYSAKVDVWSLGCVILEMYVGRRPWSTEEAIGAMYKLGSSKQAPPIPEDAKPHVSPEGKDFSDCCFVIDPKQRQTAHELLGHKFSEKDPKYNFATSKLAIDMNRSVKRTSNLLKTVQK